eukprot:Skav232153  [mRNA]  locus=scaffold1040:339798:342828:- [translate_table: standard]
MRSIAARRVLCFAVLSFGAAFVSHRYGTPSPMKKTSRRGISPRGAPSGRPKPLVVPKKEGPQWWDARNSASPVVQPPSEPNGAWRMWYYGRAGTEWAKDVKAFLPTGRIGCAESTDGLKWRRCKGPLEARKISQLFPG